MLEGSTMKSKWIVAITLISIIALSSVFIAALSISQNSSSPKEITYTSIVLAEKPFHAFIPDKFKKTFTLLDENGNTVQAKSSWDEVRILKIEDLPQGKYTLEVKQKGANESETLSFQVKAIPEQVTSEGQLKEYIRAINELNEVFAAPHTISRGGLFENLEFQVTSEDEAAKDSSGASPTEGFSESNNQVAGIEEGDISITNGKYIFTMKDQSVRIIQPSPLKELGKIDFNTSTSIEKLFSYENFLLVQSYEYTSDAEQATITIYDISKPTKPKQVHQFGQDGYTISARLFEDHFYFVSTYGIYDESNVVPSTTVNENKEKLDIGRISIYPQTLSQEYTVISKINLKDFSTDTQAFLGSNGTMYMSENAIYIAAANWQMTPFPIAEIASDRIMPVNTSETTIYKYAITDGIKKVAETTISGSLLNQFAMDEHNGYLRVAATLGSASLQDQNRNSENFIFVYDDQLNEVGRLDNLARGERIYSVRFMGDKGYMVTFVETDPLFVLDLQNPKAPVVLGELKIPGYSNYLHPIGENHLLGIGYDTAVRSDGKSRWVENLGMKLSLFNVTDSNNPIEQDVEIIGGAGTYSSVQSDHHALFRDAKYNRYGFDVTLYNSKNNSSEYNGTGAMFYEINESGITQEASFVQKEPNEQYENWENAVKRILFIEDRTFIIKNDEVHALSRETLQSIETIPLTK